MQVKYPKGYVEFTWGDKENITQEEKELRQLENKIRAKKAKITQLYNAITRAKAEWDELFPITQFKPYNNLVARYELKKCELNELKEQYAKNRSS